ncbi:MAG: PAS domain S-box protein [Ilumatobacteraceae bacterium]
MTTTRTQRGSIIGWRRAWPAWMMLVAGLCVTALLTWVLRPNDDPHIDDPSTSWGTLALGLLFTTLAVGLLLSWRSASVRAGRIADSLVQDLRAKEAELQVSQARWQFAVEGSGDGLWDWDVRGGSVWYSPQWKAMLGYEDDEVGESLDEWSSRIHPDDRPWVTECVNAYLRGETDHYECTHRVRHKDGRHLWVLDRGIAVDRDEHGSATRLIGTHRDVTSRQQLEAALRGRTSDLEQAQRLAKMGSWVLHVGNGEVEWSTPLYDMFAIPVSEPAPTYAQQPTLFAAESWARLSRAVAECVEHGTTYDLEVEAITRSGVHRSMLARGIAVRDGSGAVTEVRGIAMDVTDRTWAVGRIAHLTDLYKALSECNAVLMHATDEADLYRRVCDVVVRHNGVAMAWVGGVDRAAGRIVPVASAGAGLDYVRGVDVRVATDDPRAQGPAGTAATEGRPVWIDDFPNDPRTAPWRDRGAKFGWTSVASLPLRQGGEVVALLNLYSTVPDWLDGETKGLLAAMTDDISFTLERMRIAVQLEESEQRFRSLVEQSIAGAYIVQDHRIAYANPRFKEILGYGPNDDVTGMNAMDLFAPDEQEAALERHRAMQSGEATSQEATFRAVRKDGTFVSVGSHSSIATYRQRPAVIGLLQDIGDRKVAEAQIERYVERLESVLLQTVGVITELSSMRDPYTSNHERNVAALAVAIGHRLGLDDDRLEGLRVGGLLHDVGKIAVPAEILVKPTRLTPLELAMVREHPTVGHDLLRAIDFPWPVARVAHEHHERIDGTGYPRRLQGEQICLEARIVAVADVVDSMSTHRPYRPSLGTEAALVEIESHVGTRYDADVVRACAEIIREGGYTPA